MCVWLSEGERAREKTEENGLREKETDSTVKRVQKRELRGESTSKIIMNNKYITITVLLLF